MATKDDTVQSEGECFDRAHEAANKLHALLMHTYGESGTHLRSMSGELQDHYMWACSDLASEIVSALDGLLTCWARSDSSKAVEVQHA